MVSIWNPFREANSLLLCLRLQAQKPLNPSRTKTPIPPMIPPMMPPIFVFLLDGADDPDSADFANLRVKNWSVPAKEIEYEIDILRDKQREHCPLRCAPSPTQRHRGTSVRIIGRRELRCGTPAEGSRMDEVNELVPDTRACDSSGRHYCPVCLDW